MYLRYFECDDINIYWGLCNISFKKVKKSIQTIFYGKAKNKYALELTPDIDSIAE